MPVLLTVPEAADRLRVNRRTVDRLIKAGGLEPTRLGRRVYVSEAAIATFVERGGARWTKR